MKKNVIKITENDLQKIISESVQRIVKEEMTECGSVEPLGENEEQEGLCDTTKNAWHGLIDGFNSFKARELAYNDDNQPSKIDAHSTVNHMDKLDAQISKLQTELNRLLSKRKQLQKYYGVSKEKGSGLGKGKNGYEYAKGQAPGGNGGGSFRKSSMKNNGGLAGQANINNG